MMAPHFKKKAGNMNTETGQTRWSKWGRWVIGIPLGALVGVGVIGAGTLIEQQWVNRKLQKVRHHAASPPVATANAVAPPNRRPTPTPLKGIYMTSWVASQHQWRAQLADFVDQSELNAIVIDVKDYSGAISFKTGDPQLAPYEENRVPDMKGFIETLHQKGIYVIARITVFQDPLFAKAHPQLAVQTRGGGLWRDRHGLHYIDPGARLFWDHIIRLSHACIAVGFDELNFDYVRYPTDGNMADMRFPVTGTRLSTPAQTVITLNGHVTPNGAKVAYVHRPTQKELVVSSFFKALREALSPTGIVMSADLFGMTLTALDDVSIGQHLATASPYFDYICPMVYPSHYPPGFNGYGNPALYPYELIRYVMAKGRDRMIRFGYPPSQLRPWLQDFNLGAPYTAERVRAQITATTEVGQPSWLMWDPRNRYTRAAYRKGSDHE